MNSTITILTVAKKILLDNILNILSFIFSLVFVVVLSKRTVKSPEIVFLDIGQGDAVLIQQDNYQILVDGGPDDSILYELAKYMPWFDKRIEKLVLTHPHDDHLNGLLLLLKKYEINEILYSNVEYPNLGYEYLVKNYKGILQDVKAGYSFTYRDIFFSVIYPFDEERSQEENLNNESVVTFLVINGYKILLMGDAEVEVEKKLLDYEILESIDILKVGHHCSRSSTSESFLSFTQPEIAICLCGKGNSFGHPHYETLKKFKNKNVQYFITSEEGNVEFSF